MTMKKILSMTLVCSILFSLSCKQELTKHQVQKFIGIYEGSETCSDGSKSNYSIEIKKSSVVANVVVVENFAYLDNANVKVDMWVDGSKLGIVGTQSVNFVDVRGNKRKLVIESASASLDNSILDLTYSASIQGELGLKFSSATCKCLFRKTF